MWNLEKKLASVKKCGTAYNRNISEILKRKRSASWLRVFNKRMNLTASRRFAPARLQVIQALAFKINVDYVHTLDVQYCYEI